MAIILCQEEERKRLKEVQKKTELGYVDMLSMHKINLKSNKPFISSRQLLLHQHKAQMKRKSQQIQEALV